MRITIMTGSAGLIGSEAAELFAGKGFIVAGIDNDLRCEFLGKEASARWRREQLIDRLSELSTP